MFAKKVTRRSICCESFCARQLPVRQQEVRAAARLLSSDRPDLTAIENAGPHYFRDGETFNYAWDCSLNMGAEHKINGRFLGVR
jgi:hypothetical protein